MRTQTVIPFERREDFVVTPAIDAVCRRAATYLDSGYPVHLRGSAGTGKTTLAVHVAHARGRPVSLMFGDDSLESSHLIGREKGLQTTRVVDNFVRTVTKTEELHRPHWVDGALTTACRDGHTLVYDEFSRTRPEANNVLLMILEERMLPLPDGHNAGTHVRVHPDFRAVFTSNPADYVGVHKTQNALLDRMITIELDDYDRETEVAITAARAGVDTQSAQLVADVVRHVRSGVTSQRPTLRASIMLARILRQLGGRAAFEDPLFADACLDVLHQGAVQSGAAWTAVRTSIRSAIDAVR